MSQSQRPKGGQGGSVRRARELMEAGLQPDMPPSTQSPPRQRVGDSERGPGTASPSKPRQPMPAALSASRSGGQNIGLTISRPTQIPQWPLAASVQGYSGQSSNRAGRSQAPQRPPRPSRSKIPSMLDASKLQDHTPTFQYTPQPSSSQEEELHSTETIVSPNIKSPLTPASRASTTSSVGSIPDFPMPMPMPMPAPSDQPGMSFPGTARKGAGLGPPPTARRGASSYYSNAAIVSPIQEESPRTHKTHESYASSAVMPTSWRDDASDFLDDEESAERNIFAADPIPEEGRDSQASNGDDSSERGLVRNASVGRRGKPSMVTTKALDKTPPLSTSPPLGSDKLAKMGVFGLMEMRAAQMKATATARAAAAAGRPSPLPLQTEHRETRWPMIGSIDSPLASGTGFIESSSSESTSTLGRLISPKETDSQALSPPPLDPRMSKILHAHQAASGVQATDEKELERSFSRISAIRRPPKLDLTAVRDAESRGSLTSLPDLIRRATKLAAMIDKGKRPGSRLNNLNDFSDADLAREKEESAREARRPQSGLSGMLAAFPPPGLATPRENSPRPQPSWSTHIAADSPLGPPESESKAGRRCCGLPIWLFLIVLLVTILIIVAAVLVPLFLLVINKSSSSSSTSASQQLAQCQQITPCANGGTSIVSSGICSCICSNGFTGPTCSVASTSSCTTTTVISSTNGTVYNDVTIGNSIPRLIAGALTNFSVPLSADIILAHFSSANFSCDAENALVTFNGEDFPLGSASSPASAAASVAGTANSSPTSAPSIPPYHIKRVEDDLVTHITTSFTTHTSINQPIIYDMSSAPVTNIAASAVATTTAAPASPSGSSGGSSSDTFTPTEESLDFARVAVLYVLQKQSVANAETAQTDIQAFFNQALLASSSSSPSSSSSGGGSGGGGVSSAQAANVTIGDGNSIDFRGWNLVLQSGERVGRGES